MSAVEQTEFEAIEISLDNLEAEALPITEDVAFHTLKARKAISLDPVDTLTLSNELVELSILNQRLGDRISTMACRDAFRPCRRDCGPAFSPVGENIRRQNCRLNP